MNDCFTDFFVFRKNADSIQDGKKTTGSKY